MDYGELKTAIQDYCQNSESSFVSNTPNFIRFAENTIFSAIDLPSKWKSILNLSLADGTSEYDLGPSTLAASTVTSGTSQGGVGVNLLFVPIDSAGSFTTGRTIDIALNDGSIFSPTLVSVSSSVFLNRDIMSLSEGIPGVPSVTAVDLGAAVTQAASTEYMGTGGVFDILSVRVSPVTPFSQTNGVDYGPVGYLLQKDYDFLLEAYPGTSLVATKGLPKYYAISSTGVSTSVPTLMSEPTLTIRFGPIPDEAYQATVTYYGKTSADSITSGADSVETWLSVSFPEVLLYGSLVQAYTYMKGEPDVIQMYEKQFLDGMTLLKNMTETRRNSNSFRPASSQG